jgi:hypothetical protein
MMKTVTNVENKNTARVNPADLECIVCVEYMNKSTRKPVHCEYCEFVACRKCYQHRLLEIPEPKCMDVNCNRVWTRKHLSSVMLVKFMTTEYAAHREQVIFDNERPLFPATLEHILEVAANKKLAVELGKERVKLVRIVRQLYMNGEIDEERVLLLRDVRLQLAHLDARITELAEGRADPSNNNTVRHRLHTACPVDNCRGFLDEEWKCGLCAVDVCPSCRIPVTGAHSCNSDEVESAKAIDRDTRPCPKCSAGIYKLDGCDQMWCTQCHTAFSWTTGVIETNIHNPHYYEWMRGRSRNVGEVQCGREIDPEFELAMRREANRLNSNASLKHVLNYVNLIMFNVVTNFRILNNVNANDNARRTLREKFITNNITEKDFKKRLRVAVDNYEHIQERIQIFDMFIHSTTDILYRLLHDLREIPNHNEYNDYVVIPLVIDYKRELNNLADYANTCLKEIANAYRVPFLGLLS